MGFMKRFGDELRELENWALGFLCDVGTLDYCDIHGVYFEGPNDIETAYRVFNSQVTSGKIILGKDETRRKRTDALKAAYATYGGLEGCGWCAEAFGGDD